MPRLRLAPAALAAALLLCFAVSARADGKVELYGVRMDPSDTDSRQFSRPGWGGGLELVAPLPGTATLIAGVFGLEVVNLLSKTKKFSDPLTGLRVEQQTSQNYGRLFVGGQLGPHGRGALRPYVGLNVAGVWYGINTDVVVPDDSNRQNEIRQNLHSRDEFAFGWDASTGVDFNFSGHFIIDAGVRYVHAYGLPQQLGADAVTIQPGYIQYRVGLGFGFNAISQASREAHSHATGE
jgi:opacity protein-like surface antigen